jgi:predicted NUDIX family phosphoesterase
MTAATERVLVVPTKDILSTGITMTYSQFIDILLNKGSYIDRDKAEKDDSFLQIIPYCVVYRFTTSMLEPSIFMYQRLKGGSEARLHAKYSIGIGGHIDETRDGADITSSTLVKSALAEVREEIGDKYIYPPSVTSRPFLIYDNSNEVGRVHLGVLMKALSRSDHIEPLEVNKISGRMVSLSSILKDYSTNLENWSTRAIELCFTKII